MWAGVERGEGYAGTVGLLRLSVVARQDCNCAGRSLEFGVTLCGFRRMSVQGWDVTGGQGGEERPTGSKHGDVLLAQAYAGDKLSSLRMRGRQTVVCICLPACACECARARRCMYGTMGGCAHHHAATVVRPRANEVSTFPSNHQLTYVLL